MHRSLAILFVVATIAPAQGRIWIVDASNGPGTHFTDIPPAVAAAAPGDVLSVRAGTYSPFQVSAPLTVVGQGGVTISDAGLVVPAVVDVTGLGSGRFVLANVAIKYNRAGVSVAGSTGSAHLQDVSMAQAAYAFPVLLGGLFVKGSDVTVTGGSLSGSPAIQVIDSSVVLAGTTVRGNDSGSFLNTITPGAPGIVATRSSVALSRSDVQGGNGGASIFVTYEGEPAIRAQGSNLSVTGDPVTTLAAGARTGGLPVAGIDLAGGTLVIDRKINVRGANGGLPIAGTAVVTTRRVVSLVASGGVLGGTLRFEVVSPAADPFVVLAGAPATPVALPFGDLFLDPVTMFDAALGVQNASENSTVVAPIPSVPALRGFVLGLQVATVYSSTSQLELSNPAVVAVR